MTKNYISGFDFNDPELVSMIDDLPLWSAPFGINLLDTVELKPAIKVLDIGSGAGFPLIELGQRLDEKSEIVGIDPWEAARNRTEQKIKKWNISNIKIIDAVAENIPFDDNYFDLVVSNNGTNNVEDIEKTFDEIKRVLKPNGQLVFTANLENSFIEFYLVLKQVLNEKSMKSVIKNVNQHIFKKRLPVDSLKKILLDRNFQIKNILYDEFVYRFLNGTVMFNHFFIRLAFKEPWFSLIDESQRSEIFEEVEKRLNKIAELKGDLRMSIPFVTINSFSNDNV